MTNKIFRSILISSLVTFAACTLLIMSIMYGYFTGGISEELESEARFVAAGVESSGMDYLRSVSGMNRITWVDREGNVLFDSELDSAGMENHGDRQEIIDALENGMGKSHRRSSTLSETLSYCAIRLSDGTVIRVSTTQSSLWAILLGMLWPMVLVLLSVLLISVCLAVFMARKIVKPINDMDIENPDIDEQYEELSPLLHKINRQNTLISLQMNDLRHRQEEFRTITENMSEGLVVIDNRAEILSCNNSALKLLLSENVTFGSSVFELNRSEEFCRAVNRALGGKRSEPILKDKGKAFQLFVNPVEVEGKINGAVIVILDVTEKEDRDSMRREFTSNVSHELKTPLTSIYGISEIMMNGIVKTEDMMSFASNIHDESGRLIALINDIIKLSQLDENCVPLEKEPVNLLSVAKEVRERLRRVAEKRGITVTVTGEDAVVQGNYVVLCEMVYNLCDNSIKYNKDNGSVTVQVGMREGRPYLQVKDTGIGIPADALPRVFERFYRVDKSHSKEIGGTGLGLSIVKHGAAYHGAEIKADSRVGEGTVMEIQF